MLHSLGEVDSRLLPVLASHVSVSQRATTDSDVRKWKLVEKDTMNVSEG